MSYRLIVMDPNWNETGGGKIKRGADRHYKLSKIDQIVETVKNAEFEDGRKAFDPDPEGCQVWCWTTMNSLRRALTLFDELGVTYITHRVWVKTDPERTDIVHNALRYAAKLGAGLDRIGLNRLSHVLQRLDQLHFRARFGMGFYTRGVHEIALLGRIGKTKTHCQKIPSVLFAPQTPQHSEKPAQFYYEAYLIAGGGPACEMYARDPRPGWDVWGDEVGTDWRNKEK